FDLPSHSSRLRRRSLEPGVRQFEHRNFLSHESLGRRAQANVSALVVKTDRARIFRRQRGGGAVDATTGVGPGRVLLRINVARRLRRSGVSQGADGRTLVATVERGEQVFKYRSFRKSLSQRRR